MTHHRAAFAPLAIVAATACGASDEPSAAESACESAGASCHPGCATGESDCLDAGTDGAVGSPPAAGPRGFALAFDARLGDHVRIPRSAALEPASDLTVEAWVRFRDLQATPAAIVAKPLAGDVLDSYHLWYSPHALYGAVVDSSPTSNAARHMWDPGDAWHHVAFVYTSADATNRLYLDGTPFDAHQTDERPSYDDSDLFVGIDRAGVEPIGAHDGWIDEVRIWNVPRSRAEIAADAVAPFAPAPGLVGAWSFDEGSGTTARDASGHGADGVLASIFGVGPSWVRAEGADAK